jgi:hypothetical protein
VIFWEMSVSDKVSFFSRFFVKLVEIFAAGIATAVGGYLIAHLGGLLSASAPAPAAVQVAPSAGAVSKSPTAQPAPPISADASQQDANAPSAQPARKTVNGNKPAVPPKHIKTDTSAAESKPTESKPSDEESVEARVRAALANIDANRPAQPVVPPHQADVPPDPAVIRAQPQPVDGPSSTATAAASPRATDLQPQPAPQAPVEPGPLTAVEIKSRPVTEIEAVPAPQAAPPAREEKGLFATLKRIPDLLRPDPPGEAPRPPMPVGE